MFSVIFEVHPKPDQWDTYLATAGMLRPELIEVDGFVDNIRYRSLTRDGWILSLSGWRDEKSVVRWRTATRHHMAQEKGRSDILLDYHLRVGQITQDTRLPDRPRPAGAEAGRNRDRQRNDDHPDRCTPTRSNERGRQRCPSGPRPTGERPCRMGRLRCRADTRRRDPADVLAHQCRRGSLRLPREAAGRRQAAAGSYRT